MVSRCGFNFLVLGPSLCIFPCVHWPLVYLFCKVSVHLFALLKRWIICHHVIDFLEFFMYSGIKFLDTYVTIIFSHLGPGLFLSLTVSYE